MATLIQYCSTGVLRNLSNTPLLIQSGTSGDGTERPIQSALAMSGPDFCPLARVHPRACTRMSALPPRADILRVRGDVR